MPTSSSPSSNESSWRPPAIELEPLCDGHLPRLGALIDDPEVAVRVRMSAPGANGAGDRALARELEGVASGYRTAYAILDGGRAVGLCGLDQRGRIVGTADVDYWIGRPYWGRGLATRAVHELVGLALRTTSLRSLTSIVFTDNPASRRVLERNGFRMTGTERAGSLYEERFRGRSFWRLERVLRPAMPFGTAP